MKLSEYLYEKIYAESRKMFEWNEDTQQDEECEPLSAGSIEKWIVEWYRNSFNEIGCDGTIAQPRMPPSWLAVWKREDEMESDYDPDHGTCCRNGCEKCEQ